MSNNSPIERATSIPLSSANGVDLAQYSNRRGRSDLFLPGCNPMLGPMMGPMMDPYTMDPFMGGMYQRPPVLQSLDAPFQPYYPAIVNYPQIESLKARNYIDHGEIGGESTGRLAGALSGAALGAGIGFALGSCVPGIGNAVGLAGGALIGGTIGLVSGVLGGGYVGSKIGKYEAISDDFYSDGRLNGAGSHGGH